MVHLHHGLKCLSALERRYTGFMYLPRDLSCAGGVIDLVQSSIEGVWKSGNVIINRTMLWSC